MSDMDEDDIATRAKRRAASLRLAVRRGEGVGGFAFRDWFTEAAFGIAATAQERARSTGADEHVRAALVARNIRWNRLGLGRRRRLGLGALLRLSA